MSISSQADAPGALARVPAWLWLIGPYALLLMVFVAAPLANVVLLSVYTYSPVRIWTPDFTLDNYRQIFTPYFGGIAIRTLRIGATATLGCVLLGYPIAYYLARCSRRALAVGMFILIMPLMVSAVVGSFGWIVILGRNGLLNGALAALGIESNVTILYTEAAVVIALVHFLLPLMVLPLMASIEKISVRLEEASINLGASPVSTFFRVIVPLSRTGLTSGLILCFSIAISVVVTAALVGGRAGRMIGNEIYDQVITAYNWPFASSLSIALIILIVISMSLLLTIMRGRRTVQ
ncbi:ABC-type spermidine/putrescine transport system permease subunit I [Rhodoligotrophos appendicifer]|uniref:ABC transporter permease n=1 Tax=Rhodoligotrophos appendicifer TaxID=987056 RepID=UPI001185FE06|nr:ABC transporter permease [Rhodoligotrophos appendicifer]